MQREFRAGYDTADHALSVMLDPDARASRLLIFWLNPTWRIVASVDLSEDQRGWLRTTLHRAVAHLYDGGPSVDEELVVVDHQGNPAVLIIEACSDHSEALVLSSITHTTDDAPGYFMTAQLRGDVPKAMLHALDHDPLDLAATASG